MKEDNQIIKNIDITIEFIEGNRNPERYNAEFRVYSDYVLSICATIHNMGFDIKGDVPQFSESYTVEPMEVAFKALDDNATVYKVKFKICDHRAELIPDKDIIRLDNGSRSCNVIRSVTVGKDKRFTSPFRALSAIHDLFRGISDHNPDILSNSFYNEEPHVQK